jgi:hypothetical protein
MLVKRFFLCCLLLFVFVRAYGNDSLPIQQIWRPLVLPHGTWSEEIGSKLVQVGYSPDSKKIAYFFSPPGVGQYNAAMSYPEYSLNDNLSFSAFPLPFVTLLLTKNPLGNGKDNHAKSWQVAIDGGINGIDYIQGGGLFFKLLVGCSAKKPITDRLWYSGSLQYYDYFYQVGKPNQNNMKTGDISSKLGFQITDKFDVMAGYEGWFFIIQPEAKPKIWGPSTLTSDYVVTVQYNRNEHFSLWMGTGVEVYHDMYIPLFAGAKFFW